MIKKFVFINRVMYLLICLLGISSTFALPIDFFFGLALYKLISAALLLIVLLVLFLERFGRGLAWRKFDFQQTLLLFGAFFLAFFVALYFRSLSDVLIAISGYLFYIAPLYLFTLTRFYREKFDIYGYLRINSIMAVVIGLISVYQLEYEPTLFGMYSNTAYDSIEVWEVRRAASVMGSIQVYSCYMAFSLWSLVFLKPFQSRSLNLLVALTLGVLGLTGGSQTFIGLGVLFFIFIGRSSYFLLIPILLVFFVFGGFEFLFENSGPLGRLNRLMTEGASYAYSINSDRFGYWMSAIETVNPIWGAGLGSASIALQGEDRFNVESYFFNVYYEGGIVLLIPFFCFFVRHILCCLTVRIEKSVVYTFALMFFLYGITVHAYYSVFLFLVWFLLFFLQKAKLKTI